MAAGSATMETARPFTGPLSVSLAGLTLVALAAGSFTAALTRQLDLPRPDNSATVVVMEPREAPPPNLALARLEPEAAVPKQPAKPRRKTRAPSEDAAPLTPLEPSVAAAAPDVAVNATAAAPIEPMLQAPTDVTLSSEP